MQAPQDAPFIHPSEHTQNSFARPARREPYAVRTFIPNACILADGNHVPVSNLKKAGYIAGATIAAIAAAAAVIALIVLFAPVTIPVATAVVASTITTLGISVLSAKFIAGILLAASLVSTAFFAKGADTIRDWNKSLRPDHGVIDDTDSKHPVK